MIHYLIAFKMLFGAVIGIGALGWSLWRLVILLGWVAPTKRTVKRQRRKTGGYQPPPPKTKGTKSTGTLSKQALYSARKQSARQNG